MLHHTNQPEKGELRSNQEETKYERTGMLIGAEVTTKQTWEFFSNVSRKVDGCASSAATPIVMTVFNDAYKNMKKRGIKIRSVTDITKDNLNYCKELMQYAEVRHINHLIANFGVSGDRVHRSSHNEGGTAPTKANLQQFKGNDRTATEYF